MPGGETISDGARERARILVIDDEALIASVFELLLRDEHNVTSVTDAGRALDLLARGEPFNLILCDLMMPRVSGMVFHAEVEARTPRVAREIVFMTGGAYTAEARAFLNRVPNMVIEKPPDFAIVRVLVARRVRARRRRAEREGT